MLSNKYNLRWDYSKIKEQWKFPNGEFVFHLQISRLYCFYHQFYTGVPRLPRMELVANGTRFSQTEPNSEKKFSARVRLPVREYTRLSTQALEVFFYFFPSSTKAN